MSRLVSEYDKNLENVQSKYNSWKGTDERKTSKTESKNEAILANFQAKDGTGETSVLDSLNSNTVSNECFCLQVICSLLHPSRLSCDYRKAGENIEEYLISDLSTFIRFTFSIKIFE